MWKEYSSGYIKHNRATGLSVMIAAFISALLLSLLCGLFYNIWKYEIERIRLEEGGWQSRITGGFDQEDMETVRNFANVEKAVIIEKEDAVNETAAEDPEAVMDLYFDDMREVLGDTPRIAETIGIPQENIVYNYELLAMYLIRDSKDTAPRLVFPLFVLIMAMAALSLAVIIHSSFAVTMHARVHQFGIFSSIGATPKQIRICLLQEAAVWCTVPALAGNLLGIGISSILLRLSNRLMESGAADRHEAVFGYHPAVFLLTVSVTVMTIWISAWLPARRLSRLTPLEAMKHRGELQLKRRKNAPVLTRLFGMEGELAGNALKAQRKALRTASLSLIFSFLAFTLMHCFFTLSRISTRETYFERYQDVWDIMVTVKDTEADEFGETEEIQGLPGVNSAIVYQKAMAKRIITEDEMSDEMKSSGGFSHAAGSQATPAASGWMVNAPVVILDDESFLAYCEQIGISPRLDGAVIRNQIRDVTDPDFRHIRYMPYIKEQSKTSILRQSGREELAAEIPVLSYTEEVPALREQYAAQDYYELVHFLPVSLWKEVKGQIGGSGEDMYICILGRENPALEELNILQSEIDRFVSRKYSAVSENRIQEKASNDSQIQGMLAVLSGFCILLALIGIGNVFSNTLGFVRQRKREFARYMSVGMTWEEIRKMFCIEALVIAGRPVLFTVPLAVAAVWYMLRASYLEADMFLAEVPLMPIAVFMLGIFGTVALAYYLGWRNMRRIPLAEVLRDDTMM